MSRITFALAGAALAACAAAVEDAPVTEPREAAPVIATLELRDRRLTIASTPGGVRYEVSDASGTHPYLTLEELEAFAPELADVVRSAAARGDGVIDASLSVPVGTAWAGRGR